MVVPLGVRTCGNLRSRLNAFLVFPSSAPSSGILSRNQRRSSGSDGFRVVRFTFSSTGRSAAAMAFQRTEKKRDLCTPGFQASRRASSAAFWSLTVAGGLQFEHFRVAAAHAGESFVSAFFGDVAVL